MSFLNLVPGGCINQDFVGAVGLNVISDGLWGAHFQRHLSSRISREHRFYRDSLGLNNQADDFLSKAEELLGEMYLFPVIVRLSTKKSDAYLESMEKIRTTLSRKPQLINAWEWSWMDIPVEFEKRPSGFPNLNKWFEPGLPHGTIYHSVVRYYGIRKLRTRMHQDHQWIMRRTPYNMWYPSEYAEQLGKSKALTADDHIQIYGPLAEYHYGAMDRIAKVLKPEDTDRYITLCNKIAKIQPNYYFKLGDFLVEQKMESDAVLAYEKGVNMSDDSVTMSNKCEWLVNYYYDNGRKKEAFDLAERVAEVYSHAGLKTMADLSEKDGDLTGAEEYFIKMRDRYDESGLLHRFYLRHQDQPSFKTKSDKMTKDIFPNGMQQVSLSDFNSKPKNGTIILGTSEKLRKYGLNSGAIIVAIDGYRAINEEQYLFARGLNDDPHMSLIVWYKNRYRQVDVELEGRKFGVSIGSYQE